MAGILPLWTVVSYEAKHLHLTIYPEEMKMLIKVGYKTYKGGVLWQESFHCALLFLTRLNIYT